jgi:hypothetical protein
LSYSFLSSTTILNCDNDYLGGKFVDKKWITIFIILRYSIILF